MKKIGILTYHNSDNFGSVLQTYALNRIIIDMGYDCFVIDYRKNELARLYAILKPIHSAYDLISDAYNLLHYGQLKTRKDRYEYFRQNQIRLSEKNFNSQVDLKKEAPVADCYICGSDQVWNTGIVDFDESFLLDFVKQGKKISYAASGINKNMSKEGISLIERHISSFDAVSVRESLAKKILEDEGVKDVTCVLDPVLLLTKENWEELTMDYSNKAPYMLCYFAGGVLKEFEEYTAKLAKKMRLKRVILMPEWRNWFRTGEKNYNSGPLEFLSLIKYASFVCTNSFHATAFSIIFNKPFQVGMHVPFTEARITNLLDLCELNDREIDATKAKVREDCLDINFDKANKKLLRERDRCKQWLYNAIEGENI